MRLVRTLALSLVAIALGCASYTRLSGEQRADLRSRLTRRFSHQYLALSFYVTPFYGVSDRWLLSPVPPQELGWVEDGRGKPVPPGPIAAILPAGTRVVIDRVQFPTSLTVATRPERSPRTRTWVLVHVPENPGRQLVLVVPEEVRSEAAFEAALGRFLTREDPGKLISRWSRQVQLAIAEKHALVDMPALALQMAWGYPETIHREFPESGRKEVWTWPGGARKAVLFDGRVTEIYGE
jgi:hypothetical protein